MLEFLKFNQITPEFEENILKISICAAKKPLVIFEYEVISLIWHQTLLRGFGGLMDEP